MNGKASKQRPMVMKKLTLIIAMILAVAFCTFIADWAIHSGNTRTGYTILVLSGLWFGSVLEKLK